MSDAATSMLITALTDAFSFGVGVITTIPAVRIFCFYTCAAIILTFIYQVSSFIPLVSKSATDSHLISGYLLRRSASAVHSIRRARVSLRFLAVEGGSL
jgi:hypothetical protein